MPQTLELVRAPQPDLELKIVQAFAAAEDRQTSAESPTQPTVNSFRFKSAVLPALQPASISTIDPSHDPGRDLGAAKPNPVEDGGQTGSVPNGEVAAALRALLACSSGKALNQTVAERERCHQGLVIESRTAQRVDVLPTEKRAYFDQVAQTYANLHAGMPHPMKT